MMAALWVAGCPEGGDTTAPSGSDKPAPDPAPATTTSASADTPASAATLSPDEPPKAAVEARAKNELDNKDPAGTAGQSLAVEGTKGTFVIPTAWKKPPKSGNWLLATSADDKSRFATGKIEATDDTAAKAGEAATALGYTECTWGTPESVALGKDKLPATVADGVCKRGAEKAHTVYAALMGEDLNIVSVGGWDATGGDAASVFEVFRTAKKASGDGAGIAACCAALRQNAVSAPPEQKGAYIVAAGVCQSLINDPRGRAALSQVRSALGGAGVPGPCQ
jgi:hypothetical protein